MTDNEKAHRDFYVTMRRAREGEALRLCNRMSKRQAEHRPASPMPVNAEASAA